MAQGEVLEGFLCPLCMKDLGDVIQLQVGVSIIYIDSGEKYDPPNEQPNKENNKHKLFIHEKYSRNKYDIL